MNGVLIVDKPAGWTSHDVVNRVRRILNQRSVGHLGTLDPLATGVLPLVVGNFTRLAQFYTASEKTYEGVIRFGFATTTYDSDGERVESTSSRPELVVAEAEDVRSGGTSGLENSAPKVLELQQLAAQFVGHITQVPPPFSAKKIHGVPAYKLARKNKDVELEPVQVEVKEFTISVVENDCAYFRARVSSGTYMRSIAHDLGRLLGCGGHLASLRRTTAAEFDITQAHRIEEIEQCMGNTKKVAAKGDIPSEERNGDFAADSQWPVCASSNGREASALASVFIHPRQLLPQFPCVTADEATCARIRNGRPVNLPELSRSRLVKVFASQSDMLAIATRVAGTLFHPKIVFV